MFVCVVRCCTAFAEVLPASRFDLADRLEFAEHLVFLGLRALACNNWKTPKMRRAG